MAGPAEPAAREHAGVIAPPPLIYGVPLLAGLLLQWAMPRTLLPHAAARWLGPVVFALGFVGLPAVVAFRRAGTHPQPWRPVVALVDTGIYRWTRNPMYLGMTLWYVGASLWVNTPWPLLALPIILPLMQYGVIRREEAYLTRRFGERYLEYARRVRRWI